MSSINFVKQIQEIRGKILETWGSLESLGTEGQWSHKLALWGHSRCPAFHLVSALMLWF